MEPIKDGGQRGGGRLKRGDLLLSIALLFSTTVAGVGPWFGDPGFARSALAGAIVETPVPRTPQAPHGTATTTRGVLVPFENAPFPFDDGVIPDQNKAFFETDAEGRYHLSARGGKYRAATYSDNRSLLYVPPSFDPAKPDAAIVLFFHGNLATLAYVRDHQGVPRQLAASGLNAVLLAPQLAVDALDSSPGHFYERGFLARYLDEAATHLAALSGRPRGVFERLPVIIVAYSGGYLATAFSLHDRAEASRIKGVVLLDALFGEAAKIEDWIVRAKSDAFFLSACSEASRDQNANLARGLLARGVRVQDRLPSRIAPGDVVILGPNHVPHVDFLTTAWTRDPLRVVLERVRLAGKPTDEKTTDSERPKKHVR